MRLRDKLLIPIGLALVGVLVVNLGATRVAVRAWEQVAAQQAHRHDQVEHLLQAEVALERQVQEWKNILLHSQDEAEQAEHLAAFQRQAERVQSELKASARDEPDAEIRAQIQAVSQAHLEIGDRYQAALASVRPADGVDASSTDARVRGIDRPLDEELTRLRQDVSTRLQASTAESVRSGHWTAWGMVGGAVGLSALIAAMLLSIVHHLIVRPARLASRLSRHLLENDDADAELEDEPPLELDATDDELGQLLQALVRARDELRAERAQARESVVALERAHQAAESANGAKAAFLTAVSHELRTPLNGVLGSLQLLEESILDPSQRSLMQAASQSSRRLASLVEDILDYTEVSGGDVELVEVPFDVEDLLRNLVLEHRPAGAASGSALELLAAPGGPRLVRGDRDRLRRVVSELIDNALQATPGGEVDVVLATAETTGGARIQIDVIDTGGGIPPALRHTIFEPFTQVQSGMDRAKEGAGLGLSMCRELVSHFGGTLEYAPKTEGGSRFSLQLVLPIATEPEVAPLLELHDGHLQPGVPARPPRVLLVGPDIPELTAGLHALHMACCRASTLDDALLELAQTPFELAIVDVARVGVGSVENLRDISDSVGQLTALVARARPESRDRCLADGWDDVISDRASGDELHTLLDRWMSTPLSRAS